MPEKATIGLDYSHNNKLTLEASSFNEFTHFLFTSGYKLGKIQAGFDSLKKLEGYDAIIISTPNNQRIQSNEIEIIEKYVKNGGNLLVLSSMGGDYTNKTNLNELTHQFGFEFVSDEVNDSMNYITLQRRPILTSFTPHAVTEQVRKIVYSSACSIRVLDFIDDTDIKIEVIVNSGINCWHRRFEADDNEWIEEDYSKMPLMVVIEYFKGRVIGFGNLSMFSSLGREYGFSAFDNDIIIANILQWLTLGAISEGKVVTVNLNLDLFYWIDRILNEDKWDNVSAIVNVSLKYFKDNYKEIIDEIKRLKMQKLELRKAYQQVKEEDVKASEEDKILELIPERKKEDLEDIMSALEEVTGEKYELSLDLEKEEDYGEIEVEEGQDEKILEYTEKEVNKFQKETSKHAIWHGKPTKVFKEWLREK
jgi:Arc/MetJ-type ribon-helix-helix transcriptional regulator